MGESILTTENVEKCPLCSSHEEEFFFWNYDRLYRLPGKFGTVICKQYQLIRLFPRPTVESINQYYPEDYGAYRKPTFSIDLDAGKIEKGLRNLISLKKILNKTGFEFIKMKSTICDSFSWENTYRHEEKTGEKLEICPSTNESSALEIKKRLLEAKVKHLFKPLEGDFLSCWATRAK